MRGLKVTRRRLLLLLVGIGGRRHNGSTDEREDEADLKSNCPVIPTQDKFLAMIRTICGLAVRSARERLSPERLMVSEPRVEQAVLEQGLAIRSKACFLLDLLLVERVSARQAAESFAVASSSSTDAGEGGDELLTDSNNERP
jgi:hypothetical protein